MAAAAQWNIGTILASRQIIPHVQNTYTKSQIRSAMETYGMQVGAESNDFFSVHCSCQGFKYLWSTTSKVNALLHCAITKGEIWKLSKKWSKTAPWSAKTARNSNLPWPIQSRRIIRLLQAKRLLLADKRNISACWRNAALLTVNGIRLLHCLLNLLTSIIQKWLHVNNAV